MTMPSLSQDLGRVDEPQAVEDYAAVLSQVAAAGRALIVRRNGKDLAAVVPLEHLRLICEEAAMEEVEKTAAKIAWGDASRTFRPPQSWFDDEADNPFQPEGKPAT